MHAFIRTRKKLHQKFFLVFCVCFSFLPDGAGGGVKDAACRMGSVELPLGIFAVMIS